MSDRIHRVEPSRFDWFMLGLSFFFVAWIVITR
jgi:hypothetical protein